MDNQKGQLLVRSFNERGQSHEDLGLEHFKQRELQMQGLEVGRS